MKITKVELSGKGGLKVTYMDEDNNKVDFEGVNLVHKDFKDALNKLKPFLVDIYGLPEKLQLNGNLLSEQFVDLSRISVKKVEYKGNQIILYGSQTTSLGVSPVKTPPVSSNIDECDYEHLEDLACAVDGVISEAELYINEDKWAVIQSSIDYNGVDGSCVPFGEETAKNQE